MKRFLFSLLLWPCLSFAAPDLATTEGMATTCTTVPAEVRALKNNAERQAFAVCHDIALLQQIIRWVQEGKKEFNRGPDPETLRTELRKEFTYVRDQLKEVRTVLASLKLKPGEGLRLAPGEWQLDLDGDGTIATWERHFFAIPKRGVQPFSFNMPSNDPSYYHQHYHLDARFRIDRSDVLWALAYHQFAEGVMEMLLAHQVNIGAQPDENIELRDPAALLRAHQLIGAGIASSAALRRSLLAETDDKDEWIPNPRQKDTVFPMELDQQAYDTWGRVLSELSPLWAGKTLLVVENNAGGMLGVVAKLCPQGQGLNVATLFRKPARFPLAKDGMRSACVTVDSKHPASGLVTILNQAVERGRVNPQSPEWHFVRYLYWVN